MVGHLLGAAGAVEFITCVKELQEGFIHATVGYQIPDEECDLNYCKEPVEEEFTYALTNSWALGAQRELLVKNSWSRRKALCSFQQNKSWKSSPTDSRFCFWDTIEGAGTGHARGGKKCVTYNEPFLRAIFLRNR